jgi:hypothetical protein
MILPPLQTGKGYKCFNKSLLNKDFAYNSTCFNRLIVQIEELIAEWKVNSNEHLICEEQTNVSSSKKSNNIFLLLAKHFFIL